MMAQPGILRGIILEIAFFVMCTPNVQNGLEQLHAGFRLLIPLFAPAISNLVSVNQLNKVDNSIQHPIAPCFYQNFSSNI